MKQKLFADGFTVSREMCKIVKLQSKIAPTLKLKLNHTNYFFVVNLHFLNYLNIIYKL
jgi:hypothetical protein